MLSKFFLLCIDNVSLDKSCFLKYLEKITSTGKNILVSRILFIKLDNVSTLFFKRYMHKIKCAINKIYPKLKMSNTFDLDIEMKYYLHYLYLNKFNRL